MDIYFFIVENSTFFQTKNNLKTLTYPMKKNHRFNKDLLHILCLIGELNKSLIQIY